MFIEILRKSTKQTKKLIIGVVYRHPVSNYAAFLTEIGRVLQDLNHSNTSFILLGDYNIDLFKQASDIKSRNYFNDIYSAGGYSLINKPTKITSTSETLLNHIYSNIFHKPCPRGVLESDISDHLPTFCIVQENFAKQNQPKIQVRDKKHFNSEL